MATFIVYIRNIKMYQILYTVKNKCYLILSYAKAAPCLVWCPYKTTPFSCHAYLWVRAPRSMSPP